MRTPDDLRAIATRLRFDLRDLDRRWRALTPPSGTFQEVFRWLRTRNRWSDWYGLTDRELAAIEQASTAALLVGDADDRLSQRARERDEWEARLAEQAASAGQPVPAREVPKEPGPAPGLVATMGAALPWLVGAYLLVRVLDRRQRAE